MASGARWAGGIDHLQQSAHKDNMGISSVVTQMWGMGGGHIYFK